MDYGPPIPRKPIVVLANTQSEGRNYARSLELKTFQVVTDAEQIKGHDVYEYVVTPLYFDKTFTQLTRAYFEMTKRLEALDVLEETCKLHKRA